MLKMSLLLLLFGVAVSAHSNFNLATSGCAMAHCSPYAGGNDPLSPPKPPTGGGYA
jgi:hypothetical protein